jgi:heat-inducible transcriptional repressor
MITERQKSILERVIEEYTKSAHPVSSQLIEEKYDFGVCPATIRNEMQKLTDSGFLHQPHTSAGRLPTDKGYRFFVDNLLKKEIADLEDVFEIEEILKEEKEDIFRFASHLSRALAAASSSLAAIHLFETDFFWKEGWEEILREPEFKEKDFISEFTDFLKSFEDDVKKVNVNSEVKVYIGKENPFGKTKSFSIISAKCYFPDREEGTISLIGPKRMAYERNISLINSITKILEEL